MRRKPRNPKRVSTRGMVNDPQVQVHPPAMQALWRIHVGSLRPGENRISIDDYARVSQQKCHWTVDNIIANCADCSKMRRSFARTTGLTTAAEFLEHALRIDAHTRSKET